MPPTVVYHNRITCYERECGKIVCVLIHVFITCWWPFVVLTLLGPVVLMGTKDTKVAKHHFWVKVWVIVRLSTIKLLYRFNDQRSNMIDDNHLKFWIWIWISPVKSVSLFPSKHTSFQNIKVRLITFICFFFLYGLKHKRKSWHLL